MFMSVFLISSYGAPLAQRASYLALHSSLFGPDGSVNWLKMYSQIVEPIWPRLQKLSKTLVHVYNYSTKYSIYM